MGEQVTQGGDLAPGDTFTYAFVRHETRNRMAWTSEGQVQVTVEDCDEDVAAFAIQTLSSTITGDPEAQAASEAMRAAGIHDAPIRVTRDLTSREELWLDATGATDQADAMLAAMPPRLEAMFADHPRRARQARIDLYTTILARTLRDPEFAAKYELLLARAVMSLGRGTWVVGRQDEPLAARRLWLSPDVTLDGTLRMEIGAACGGPTLRLVETCSGDHGPAYRRLSGAALINAEMPASATTTLDARWGGVHPLALTAEYLATVALPDGPTREVSRGRYDLVAAHRPR